MGKKSVLTSMETLAVKGVIKFLDEKPQEGLRKILEWADKVDTNDRFHSQKAVLNKILDNEKNNWNQFISGLWNDISPEIRKTIFENFFVNAALIGMKQQEKIKKEQNCNIPWAILIDITTACNLHCTGCWAEKYGHGLELSYDDLDNIIQQGKSMGVYMYLFTGGEPLLKKKDILRLCKEHSDCVFLAFTNGTLIDEEFAQNIKQVKNFIPAISIEGFEDENDARRGKGTYKFVERAMAILQKNKLLFGVSCCYTSQNIKSICSEEFIDMLIEKGSKFAWFFHYMPVGNAAVTELLPSPEQRSEFYLKIREYRNSKPLFTIDFQNDAEYIGGCVAGGRRYFHINANGDVEPCVFVHYSDSNIKNKSLLEALKSPLFMAYKERQPFNNNMLRPCPMLENPEILKEIVENTKVHSTDLSSPEKIENLYNKCKPYADQWHPEADKLWMISLKNK